MSTKLKVLKENAVKAHEAADANGKKLLEGLFPGELVPVLITDRVKTFEDACEVLGIDPDAQLPYDPTNKFELAMNAFAKLNFIVKALNEGWEPDWKNSNQYKYYPWFKANESGFGFSLTYCDLWRTLTAVGSRLCFKTSDLAIYAGKQFEAIYNEFLTL